MELKEYLDYLVDWLKEQLIVTNAKGYILGVSGGIDSALVAALITKATNNTLGVIMPCYSQEEDLIDAKDVCDTFSLEYKVINLESTFDSLKNTLFTNTFDKAIKDALSNTKARLRMTTLYALGQSLGYLVVGTDNKDEWHTGYFTKYGDGGVDLVPIINLNKREVWEASKLLGVNDKIIKRIPTAGLANGQTDESELKVTYSELDDYLDGKEIKDSSKERIEYLHKISEHKRNIAARPAPFKK